jgi:hypothetical protein
MNTQPGFEKCVSFMATQLHTPAIINLTSPQDAPKLAVTISRQSGSGGHAVGEKLAQYLQIHGPRTPLPWMMFDRNLVTQVIEDHHLPHHLARVMPEDRISDLTDMLHEVFGVHPPFWTFVRQTSETILRLANQGNTILLGRGANLVTRTLPHVLHVRLVASLERRLEHTQEIHHVGKKAALEIIQREDQGRQRYLKKYFNQNIDDPLLYDLVINTDLVSYDDAARLIGNATLGLLERKPPLSANSIQVQPQQTFVAPFHPAH